jgi:pilus assembly protein CpaB
MERILRAGILAIAVASGIFLVVMMGSNMLNGKKAGNHAAQPEQQAAAQSVAPTPSTKVLVATRDLNVGDRLTPADLAWQAWPEAALNAAYIIDGGDPALLGKLRAGDPAMAAQQAQGIATASMATLSGPQALEKLNNAVVRVPIFRGEPILEGKLVKSDGAGVMSAVLTPGKRAMAMAVSVENASGGFILPGDRVDVILSRAIEIKTDGQTKQSFVSTTILRNIKVLAIDQKPAAVQKEVSIVGATATLELTPEQSEALASAVPMGRISLVLRSVADINDPTTVTSPSKGAGTAEGFRVIRAGRLSNS